MSKHSFILLSLLVASAVAIPWHEEGIARELPVSRQSSSQMGSSQHKSKYHPSCQVAIAEGFRTATSTFDTSYVYICESANAIGICYFSALQKCCSTPANVDSLVSEKDLNVGYHKNVSVALHTSEQGMCVSFQKNNKDIELCESSSRHFPPRCAAVIPGKVEIESTSYCNRFCDFQEENCQCVIGYALPSCCNCLFDRRSGDLYFNPRYPRRGCQRICTENTVAGKAKNCFIYGGCSECKEGFNRPDCCTISVPCGDNEVNIYGRCTDCGPRRKPDPTKTRCICKFGRENYRGLCPILCGDNQVSYYGQCIGCVARRKPDPTKTRCICKFGREDIRGLCSNQPEEDLIHSIEELLDRLD